jgi:hypothetical protein
LTDKVSAIEVSSITASGPTGMPTPIATFSINAAGTPSASIAAPSFVKVPNTRLVKKPRESLTTIGVLPICCT